MPCHGPEPGWLIAYLDAPATIAGWILNITDSYIGIYLLLIAFLLVIGTFLSPLSAIIIFMPIFQQLAAVGGFNDIHMGLIIIMTLSLGMVTPPYGTCLMITSQIGEITMPQAFKHVAPILLVTVAVIILFVIFPELLLFVPRMLVPLHSTPKLLKPSGIGGGPRVVPFPFASLCCIISTNPPQTIEFY